MKYQYVAKVLSVLTFSMGLLIDGAAAQSLNYSTIEALVVEGATIQEDCVHCPDKSSGIELQSGGRSVQPPTCGGAAGVDLCRCVNRKDKTDIRFELAGPGTCKSNKRFKCEIWRPIALEDRTFPEHYASEFCEAADQIARGACEKESCADGCSSGECKLDIDNSDLEPQRVDEMCYTTYTCSRSYKKICGEDDKVCEVQE